MAEIDEIIEQPSESQKRITQLSDKVRTTAEERDTANTAKAEAEAKTAELQRERDFYAGFADVVSTNPVAKDHKDDILEKVKSGYTVEDATFAVLGKAGKLGAPAPVEMKSPAGGSAPNQIIQGGIKSASEMTQVERREALMSAEKNGDISFN